MNNYLKAFCWHYEPGAKKERVEYIEVFDDRTPTGAPMAQRRMSRRTETFVNEKSRPDDPAYRLRGGYRPAFQFSVYRATPALPGVPEIGTMLPIRDRVLWKMPEEHAS